MPPVPAGASDDVELQRWEEALAQLITLVADRTETGESWYGLCYMVLRWFLTVAGVPEERHADVIADAVWERFDSWVRPGATLVADVAQRLALEVAVERRA